MNLLYAAIISISGHYVEISATMVTQDYCVSWRKSVALPDSSADAFCANQLRIDQLAAMGYDIRAVQRD